MGRISQLYAPWAFKMFRGYGEYDELICAAIMLFLTSLTPLISYPMNRMDQRFEWLRQQSFSEVSAAITSPSSSGSVVVAADSASSIAFTYTLLGWLLLNALPMAEILPWASAYFAPARPARQAAPDAVAEAPRAATVVAGNRILPNASPAAHHP
jgi:hypothetical protein